jgi:hypothetical protein
MTKKRLSEEERRQHNRDRVKKWSDKPVNKERRKKYMKEWRSKNKDRIGKYQRKYYEGHKDNFRQYNKDYRDRLRPNNNNNNVKNKNKS